MDWRYGGLWEDYLGGYAVQNPILTMDNATPDDEFVPGTPLPQNAWEGGVVGNCTAGGNGDGAEEDIAQLLFILWIL